MSMKFFTLSAVCVLVYCFMMVLTGITDLGQEDLKPVTKLSLGNRKTVELSKDTPGATAVLASGDLASSLEEWGTPGPEDKTDGGRDYARQIRSFGILFILGWVFISFKLLSSHD